MTSIFYSDCQATSPSGRFILEARSPHNGTIRYRDGRQPSENDFAFKYREHQSHFRYQLLEASSGGAAPRVVWERWQGKNEDSPHELVVSDDGWSVLRLHGFSPEVSAVSPSGHDTVQVRVLGEHSPQEKAKEDKEPEPRDRRLYEWRASRLSLSTAGTFWAGYSWPYFFRRDDTTFFVWRTYWGQRLVLDLTHAAVIAEDAPAWASLARSMDEEEKQGVYKLLSDLSARLDEVQRLLAQPHSEAQEPNPLRDKLRRAVAAFHLVGVHRIQECVPLLQRWEAIDCPSYSTGSTAFSGRSSYWLEAQYLRPILHHSLRLLGVQPQGFATYHFTQGKERLQMPELVPHRRQRAAELKSSMSAEQVLQCIGSPDHIRRRSHPVGTLYRWTEEWEYDFQTEDQWVTLRIAWEEVKRKSRIASIEEVPASWLQTDERALEILNH